MKKNQKIKKTVAGLSAAVIMLSGAVFTTPQAFSGLFDSFSVTTYAASTVVNQKTFSPNNTYGTGTLRNTGCGIFSFANAVNYLNGNNVVNVPTVASWAHSIGAYNSGNTADGTIRATLYNNIQGRFGSTYKFTVGQQIWGNVSSSTLKNHLKNGGVAAAHVSNHFIALVGYNSSTDKYHVLESYVSSTRSANIPSNDCWVSSSKLRTGKTNVDWFVLLSKKSSVVYFPRYTGTSGSIVTALNAVGADSSYSYRCKIAAKNNISNYTGTANQNTTMVKLLKAGKLIKP
ncbi:MAG: hypothetical protein Q4F95_11410 [Oscillospiraceae bacterium]|nr:hypothetical protein [Oscillospiraceae bacterium]